MRVLVVDDSAVVRQAMTALLEREGDIEVAVAADPLIAMRKMEKARPDVLLLDLEMPRMGGLEFLAALMQRDPMPVVICSGLARRGTEAAMRALALGAVDIVERPRLGLRGFVEESALLLVETLRGAARARMPARALAPPSSSSSSVAAMPARALIALGASTGGTEALRVILAGLPAGLPPVAIVQHMPAGFTAAFAYQLDQVCALRVVEAHDGLRLDPGMALVAPGGRHLRVVRRGHALVAELDDGPLVSRHRPSVDVLFRSVARAVGRDAVGVLLTGMGDDGADGLGEMKRAGATTIAQNEATSVVFGMPREAILRGAADEVLPLGRIAASIRERLASGKDGGHG
ncbi:MAG TPA: chemotaxis response regulator protein-glutamate methylesterase [Polyangia bacterium]